MSNYVVVSSTAYSTPGADVPANLAPLTSKVSSVVLGRSNLTGVVVGQDSSSFNRKKGFGFDCYYNGEIVSMARSDGRRTIGQILSISAAGATVDMGSGARKDLSAADIPHKMSKLLGLFYLSS
jgi:hypothetical protein